jgi:hypothetical protein
MSVTTTLSRPGQEGSGRNPTDLMISALAPCSWRSSTSITASHHRFSIRDGNLRANRQDGNCLNSESTTRQKKPICIIVECDEQIHLSTYTKVSVSVACCRDDLPVSCGRRPSARFQEEPKLYVGHHWERRRRRRTVRVTPDADIGNISK